MVTNTKIALMYWSTKIGGISTIIPSIVDKMKDRQSTRVYVFLKRRNGKSGLSGKALYHFFSENIYRGHQLRFFLWLLWGLYRTNPDYMVTFLNRFAFVAVLYKLIAWFFGRKPQVIVNQAIVTSAYLQQYEAWYWHSLTKYVFRYADRIIVNARTIRDDLCHNFSVSSDKICYIPSWIKPMNINHTHKTKYDCIFVGRLAPEKGIETVLDTAEMCRKKIRSFSLAIIGDGALRFWMEDAIRKRGLGPCVSYLGYQKNPRRIMQQARLLLLPSYNEGLPMVVLEAYSVGVPVAVTPFLGAEEAVEHNKTGIIVKRSNYPTAVYELLKNETKLSKMGRVGLEKAKKDFSMKNLDRFIEAIFSS